MRNLPVCHSLFVDPKTIMLLYSLIEFLSVISYFIAFLFVNVANQHALTKVYLTKKSLNVLASRNEV